MIAPDTSVVVAAFASWHEHHKVAERRLGTDARLIGHVAFETVSTLTRLPEPFRVEPRPVLDFLSDRFGSAWLVPNARQTKTMLTRAVERGISGGALYDALVAGVAATAGATLLSLDHRAKATYRDLDTPFEMLA